MIVIVHHVMIVKGREVYAGSAAGLEERSTVGRHPWLMLEEVHPGVVMIFDFVPALTRLALWVD
jgi:hypothetical protein